MKNKCQSSITEEAILAYDNVPVDVAANFIGWSTSTLYYALQEERAPFGFAVRRAGSSGWTYNISPGLLIKYKRGDLPTYRLREVEMLAADGIERIVTEKLSGLQGVLRAALGG